MAGNKWCSSCRFNPPEAQKAKEEWGAMVWEVAAWWRYQFTGWEAVARGPAALVSSEWWFTWEQAMKRREKMVMGRVPNARALKVAPKASTGHTYRVKITTV
jgi:hypothetical protein